MSTELKGWTPERLGSLAGKTYVITGTTSGTGFEATRVFLSKGARVVMLNRNPDKAADLFAVNPRFIFFREIEGDGPIGSQGVALSPGRSMAVDTAFVPLGLPLWLDTTWPGETDRPLNRLMVAQDTGGAIKGLVRGDFFWGYGDEALAMAGKMKSRGGYYLLVPRAAASRHGAPAS